MIKILLLSVLLSACSVTQHSTSLATHTDKEFEDIHGFTVTQTIYYK